MLDQKFEASAPNEIWLTYMFTKWESALAPEIEDAFHPLARAVSNWMPEIIAYFNSRANENIAGLSLAYYG
ncbi:MAG TPA: hypothetical protein DCG53_04315 [Syntrophus sp. (in: bacteria)]|nr:hypothetical protein [Syntrophus sp. (in: bacteria)]